MNMGSAYHKQSTWKTSKRGLAFIDLLLQKRCRSLKGLSPYTTCPERSPLYDMPLSSSHALQVHVTDLVCRKHSSHGTR